MLFALFLLGFYIMIVEESFIRESLKDAYHQLSEESKVSRAGHLLWTSHGVTRLVLLGSLVWLLAAFRFCLDLLVWQKGSPRAIVASMFLMGYFVVNYWALYLPVIPDNFANWFGIIPVFPVCAIIATWVFFWTSRAKLQRWKLVGIVFSVCFIILGCTSFVISALSRSH